MILSFLLVLKIRNVALASKWKFFKFKVLI